MKKTVLPDERDLEWSYFDKCGICHLAMEVASTGPESVSLRHSGTKLPWEVCRRQRMVVGQRGEEKQDEFEEHEF